MAKFIGFLALAICYANAVPLSSSEFEAGSRISNGAGVNQIGEFPYVVSLQLNSPTTQNTDTRGHRCGGVLITLQHVLTSASCLSDVSENGTVTPIDHRSYQVFGGAVALVNTSGERLRTIANYTVHPQFIRAPAHVNDIAIVTLAQPFLATVVTPLALPAATFNPPDFTVCSVAGWGATTNVGNATSPPPTANPLLRSMEKYVYNQNLCSHVFNVQHGVINIQPSMICSASLDVISNGCTGDLGNALVCNNTLTGILFHHNNCDISSFPELYTRVNNYTAWIRGITGSASGFNPGLFMLSLLTISQFVFAKVVS